MRTYSITIQGVTPLILHHDNVEWSDRMEAWKLDPKNKKYSKAGDDRTPAWRWLGCLYYDDKQLTMPQANISRALLEGGAMVLVPGGKRGKTFKAQTQSGLRFSATHWPLIVNGNTVALSDIEVLEAEDTFSEHVSAVRAKGFDLLVKRAKIGQAKHVRVRPIFDRWSIEGDLTVLDAQITTEVLQDIVRCAGLYKGLGDWRPGGRTPGPYGQFEATVIET